MKKKIGYWTAVISLGLLLHYCSTAYFDSKFYYKSKSNGEQFGQSFNSERAKRKLPLIEDNWLTKDLSKKRTGLFRNGIVSNTYWKKQVWSEYRINEESFHLKKIIYRDSENNLNNEVDYFKLGQDETIQLNYDYKINRFTGLRIKQRNDKIDTVILVAENIDSLLNSIGNNN